MAPAQAQNGAAAASQEAGAVSAAAMGNFPPGFLPPEFTDPYKARAYLKERLALAYRIFAKHGFDEGVAGHITLRVSVTRRALLYQDSY